MPVVGRQRNRQLPPFVVSEQGQRQSSSPRAPVYRQSSRGRPPTRARHGGNQIAARNGFGNQQRTLGLSIQGSQPFAASDLENRNQRQDDFLEYNNNASGGDITGNERNTEEVAILLKENEALVQQLSCLLKEVDAVDGSSDKTILQEQCSAATENLQLARKLLIRQLTGDNTDQDKQETVLSLIRQLISKFQRQKQEFDRLKDRNEKHLRTCKEIKLNRMEEKYKAQLKEECSKRDEEKKKVILDKMDLREEVNKLRGEMTKLDEERSDLEKGLRQKTNELWRLERQLTNAKSEQETFTLKLSKLEIQLENAATEKQRLENQNADLKTRLEYTEWKSEKEDAVCERLSVHASDSRPVSACEIQREHRKITKETSSDIRTDRSKRGVLSVRLDEELQEDAPLDTKKIPENKLNKRTRSNLNGVAIKSEDKEVSDKESNVTVQPAKAKVVDETGESEEATSCARKRNQWQEETLHTLHPEDKRYHMDKFFADQYLNEETVEKTLETDVHRRFSNTSAYSESHGSDLLAASMAVHRRYSTTTISSEISSCDSEIHNITQNHARSVHNHYYTLDRCENVNIGDQYNYNEISVEKV